MTQQEFNDFIKANGLIDEFNQEPITEGNGWFGPGWYELTAALITDLIALGWDKQVGQAKEKFGGGRFYIGAGSREIHDRIRKWETETFKTCEFCGATEGVTTSGRWLKTLCEACRDILNKRNNQ